MNRENSAVQWRKSSYSNGQGECIEVADGVSGHHLVRDSKDPDGPALLFAADEWVAFVGGLKAGEFPIA
ncbi:DUF397 domain-containing protein [Kitasatospora sp. NPDC056327]|uniref:DUF397 domain-containing protein n=1 Tax=Kitasatospora sp. NPDC056327 TaxID=3345785 RepID=UPI0035DFC29A